MNNTPSNSVGEVFTRRVEQWPMNTNESSTALKDLYIDQSLVGECNCVVWDASLLLCRYMQYLDFHSPKCFSGTSVIELGSGTGVVALQAALLGANVVATDLSHTVQLLKHNIEKNAANIQGHISCQPLEWGNKDHIKALSSDHYDNIIICDCLYDDLCSKQLFLTLLKLVNGSPVTTLWLCYEKRPDKANIEKWFLQELLSLFEVNKVDVREMNDDEMCHWSQDFIVVKARLRTNQQQRDTE